MKNQKRSELKVGITVLIGFVIFILIFGWAKNFSAFADKNIVNIRFDNAAGIEAGDPVMINGVRKGNVKSVQIRDGNVLVQIAIDKDVTLRQDARFSIMMLDLMGGKKIEVYPGQSKKPLDVSKVQKGKFKGDISTAVASLSSVQNDLVDVIKEIKFTLHETNSFLQDEEFKNNLKSTVENLNKVSVGINNLIQRNSKGINRLVSNGNRLINSTDSLLTDNRDNISDFLKESKMFLLKSNELLDSTQRFVNEVRTKKNNLGKVLYDKEALNNLQKAMVRLNKLMKILLKQLNDKGINVDANIEIF